MKIVILVVFVSFGGIFFLGGLVAAICCYLRKMKKEEKKIQHETTGIIHVDDHRRVKEAIVPGPHGPRAVVLEIDDDLHVDGVVKKDEVVENIRGGKHHEHGHGGCDITTEVVGSSSNQQRPNGVGLKRSL